MIETHYEVLGVAIDASPAEVRAAYVALARTHHPDQHASATAAERDANEREMQRINTAWQVLGDADRRRRYDETLDVESSSVLRRSKERFEFVPFDDADDEVHPDLLDDGVEGTEVGRSLQVGPAVFLLAGLFGVVVGAVVQLPFLLIVGVIGLVLGALSFLAAPIVALSRSRTAERGR